MSAPVWQRLSNGRGPLFFGPLQPYGVECAAPGAEPEVTPEPVKAKPSPRRRRKQPVDAPKGVHKVDAMPLADKQRAQVEQLPTAQAGADAVDEDADVLGHGDPA